MMMNSIPCCSSLYNQTNPCDANSQSQRASCFRPLQQLYKTVYCPDNGNKSSPMVVACICRPSERYKTTNMTYGSFYYDQSLMRSGTAGRPNCGSRSNEISPSARRTQNPINTLTASDRLYESQPTSDGCCPTNCSNSFDFSQSPQTVPCTSTPLAGRAQPCSTNVSPVNIP